MWLMKGHQTSVTHILMNSKNSSILFSISKDKVLSSWSMALTPAGPCSPARTLAQGC